MTNFKGLVPRRGTVIARMEQDLLCDGLCPAPRRTAPPAEAPRRDPPPSATVSWPPAQESVRPGASFASPTPGSCASGAEGTAGLSQFLTASVWTADQHSSPASWWDPPNWTLPSKSPRPEPRSGPPSSCPARAVDKAPSHHGPARGACEVCQARPQTPSWPRSAAHSTPASGSKQDARVKQGARPL